MQVGFIKHVNTLNTIINNQELCAHIPKDMACNMYSIKTVA